MYVLEMMKSFFRNVGSANISATVFEKFIHHRFIHTLATIALGQDPTYSFAAMGLPPPASPQ
jgi:hypothetical protein